MKKIMMLTNILPMLEDALKESVLSTLKEHNLTAESTEVKRIEIETEAKDIDNENRSITAFLSTRHLDRDNEIVMPKGLDLTQFKLNPVILEGHDYRKAQIGRADNLRKDDLGLKAKITFAPTIEGQVDYFRMSKFMPLKFSIGFAPLDILKRGDDGFDNQLKELSASWPEFGKSRKSVAAFIQKAMILEASVTPMPSNVHASQLSKSIDDAIADRKITEEDAKIVRKSFQLDDVEAKEKQDVPDNFKSWDDFYEKTEPCGPDGVGIYEQKPFPNEHSARLIAPGGFDEFRRRNNAGGTGVHFIFGIKKGPPRKSQLQAVRFDRTKFTVAQERSWLKDHDRKPILFEEATGKSVKRVSGAIKPYAPKIKAVAPAITNEDISRIVAKGVENRLALASGKV